MTPPLPEVEAEVEAETEQLHPLTTAEAAALESAPPELQQLVGRLQTQLQTERSVCTAELAAQRGELGRLRTAVAAQVVASRRLEFCGIPLTSLRENSITELDLEFKGVGVPGVIVLSKLLPSAAALTSLKCACCPNVFAFLSAPADTFQHQPHHPSVLAVCEATNSVPKEEPLLHWASRAIRRCNG